MSIKLKSYLSGNWSEGAGTGVPLINPVTNETLATATNEGLDLAAALDFARTVGGKGLRALGYTERASILGQIAEVLQAKRADYLLISRQNLATTEADASFDIDGAIYTLKYYARAGKSLGSAQYLHDGALIRLAKTDAFQAQHFLMPLSGVAIFINAFNFPAWGLWEKAAAAILSGMPVFAKPASSTAWLAQRMVADVIEANILPQGTLSILCGGVGDLVSHVSSCDVISFTGSADTATKIRSHPAVQAHSVRLNIEADSVNAAIVGSDVTVGSTVYAALIKEIIREMTIKAGQKCTAIRRVLVPQALTEALAQSLASELSCCVVGNPELKEVSVGPLINSAQCDTAKKVLAELLQECRLVYGGNQDFSPVGASVSDAFFQPTVLCCDDAKKAKKVHEIEVFAPLVSLIPYLDSAEAISLARRGQGALVASIYSDDAQFVRTVSLGIADLHGRLYIVNSACDGAQTGHGNVLPTCLHGGGGRAGGGEELGGLRALGLYNRRTVVQAHADTIAHLKEASADAALLVQ